MALGHCSHEHYPVLFEELPSLVEEYTRSKQRRGTAARPEEVRDIVHDLPLLIFLKAGHDSFACAPCMLLLTAFIGLPCLPGDPLSVWCVKVCVCTLQL